jgi:GT2 family glycosyltransferase
MRGKQPEVSVVISHYNVHEKLLLCLASLTKHTRKTRFEVIVNENDLNHPVGKELLKKFPTVIYITAPRDLGFGGGHNNAESQAKGEYIFLLNADTLFKNDVIDALVSFHKKQKKAGIISPLLYDETDKPYPLQGSAVLTPLRGIFTLTIFNRLFYWLPLIKNYWQAGWDKTQVRQIDVVPGTAIFMKRRLFENIGRFDEKMFIYFEDYDLSKRVLDAGYENYIIPTARLFHEWGASTTNKNIFNKHFADSRFYYFKKHYGIISAFLVTITAEISAVHLLAAGIVFLLLVGIYLIK